jgi:hypothetical protein
MRGIIRHFFERDCSIAHCCGAVAVTYAIFRGHYVAAIVLFVVAVAICVIGERALERE